MSREERIAELRLEIKDREDELRQLETEKACESCPYHVGEIISHKKNGRKKARIDEILPDTLWGYQLWGTILKKDGSDSLITDRRLWHWDWRKS